MSISTYTGLNTALTGLMASQQALDITGDNITNANTPGYTQQVATLEETPDLQTPEGLELGTGVTVTGYQRIRDAFLDVQLRAQTMLQGSAQATESGLNQVQQVVNEPSTSGLNSLLSAYYSAWGTVADNPSDMSARQALVESASSLASGFNSISSQLKTIQSQTQTQVSLTVTQINNDVQTVQNLNQAIAAGSAAGQSENTLLDQRDVALDDLATLGNLTTTNNTNGSVAVALDGVTLTDGTTAYTASVSGDTLSNNASTPQSATIAASAGTLGGEIQLAQTTIPGYLTTLNKVAGTLITQTNAIQAGGTDANGFTQAGGYGLDGSTGQPFFSGTNASNIAVAVNATQVAAAATANSPGDNTVALAQANVEDETLAPLGTSVSGAYAQLVTQVGSDTQSSMNAVSNANVIVQSLQNQRDSVSGVSIDQEMTNLVEYQQGYEASARALTAMQSVVNTLIAQAGAGL